MAGLPPHGKTEIAKILVVIALPEERDYFQDVIAGRPAWTTTTPRSRYRCAYESTFGRVGVVVQTLQGMGNIEATLRTASAISSCDPRLVVLVGLAGSLDPSTVQLGDVVISNQAKLYSSDKVCSVTHPTRKYKFSDAGKAEPGDVMIDGRDRFMTGSFLRYERRFVECENTHDLMSNTEEFLNDDLTWMRRAESKYVPNKYREGYEGSKAKIHAGWILSSPHVVDSAEYRDYLVDKNESLELDIHRQLGEPERVSWAKGKLLAVDMESFGVLKAVEALRAPAYVGGCPNLIGGIIVRGISDLCEEKNSTDDGSGSLTRKYAVENATEAAVRILESMDYAALFAR